MFRENRVEKLTTLGTMCFALFMVILDGTIVNVAQGAEPLLVIDAWEHAYYLQYRNNRASYVDAIWNVVDWADVADRFAHVCHGH